jgi:hypothetical protein
MAKRNNNYKRITERADYKKSSDIDNILDYLQANGKLPPKEYLSPKNVNERCLKYYEKIQKINTELNDDGNNLDLLKNNKSKYQGYVINLVSIVISSVIKRFKTLYPTHYDDVYTECVLDILLKIDKNKYDFNKSSWHSYCYETSY